MSFEQSQRHIAIRHDMIAMGYRIPSRTWLRIWNFCAQIYRCEVGRDGFACGRPAVCVYLAREERRHVCDDPVCQLIAGYTGKRVLQ